MGLFSSARTTPLKFGCFGKLPVYGDFVSLNCEGPEAQSLAAWLHDGVGAFPLAHATANDQALAYVWHPAGARRTLVGVLWPSADTAGRKFPFTMFAAFPDTQLTRSTRARVLSAEPVWRRILELHAQMQGMTTLREQITLMNVAPPVPLELRDAHRALADRARATAMHREEGVALGVELQEFEDYADALRESPEVPDFALRLRLCAGLDPVAEAAVWIWMMLARLAVDELDAAIFVRTSRTAGNALHVFHRSLEAADLGFLLVPADGYRFADSVGFRGVAASVRDARALETFQRGWTAAPPTLAVLLELAGHALPPSEAGAIVPAPLDAPSGGDDGDSNAITGELPAAMVTASVAPPAPSTSPVGAPPAALAPQSAPPPAPPRIEAPTTGAFAKPVVSPAPVTDEPSGVTGVDVISKRIAELASEGLLPGRLVRVSTSSASSVATGEAVGASAALLYVENGGVATLLAGVAEDRMRRIQNEVAGNAEARRLIEELRRLHKATEDRLQALVDEACARTARPDAE